MTLVSVRIPTTDLDALRLAAQVTGGSVAHEIRLGIQMRLSTLRTDPGFVEEARAKRDAFDQLIGDLERDVSVSGTRAREADGVTTAPAGR